MDIDRPTKTWEELVISWVWVGVGVGAGAGGTNAFNSIPSKNAIVMSAALMTFDY